MIYIKTIPLIRTLIILIVTFLLYYLILPPLNMSSPLFWIFLIVLMFVYSFIFLLTIKEIPNIIINKIIKKKTSKKQYLLLIIPGIILVIMTINIFNSPFFSASSYYRRISINEDGDFNRDVKSVDFNSLPLLDKDSSQKLGDRVMGQMPELVSQFYVSNLYTQINYNNEIIRVTPLEYNGIIKWLTNRQEGIMGYITVNSVTGESKLVKLETGMKYMPSAKFNDNLYRHLRFKYPTEIFGKETFEIDNEGNPYWIIPLIKYEAVGLKEDIKGVIIVDPITGNTQKYSKNEVPEWVDHVYSAELLINQVNDWGKYKTGYFNSIFGQKGVVQTTEGYNYLAQNNDIYLYTGITSTSNDESNIGFILINLRTKQTTFYPVAGAEEYSAMASAEGQVQQMNYVASFPLLINLNGKPTYLMSLKDYAGLVKMYAFVDVVDYQKVVVTDSSEGIEKAASNYLGENFYTNDTLKTKDIIVKDIKNILIDGNSYFYITSTENERFRISIKVNNNKVPFININDKINVSYQEKEVNEILKIN